MKKKISLIMAFLLLFITVLPVNAQFENPPIVDNADYLFQSELDELSEKLDKVRTKYDFEVSIYTERNLSSYSAQASADDIYDYNGYGAGENDNGIMLYICSGTREYHFTTHGTGEKYFNSNGLIYLESKVLPYLTEGDFYEAFDVYIETCDELLQMAENGTVYNKKQNSSEFVAFVIVAALLIPLIIAFIMMRGKLKKMKSAVSDNLASNYIKPGSMKIDVARDMFLYSNITKTRKANSSSGSHISSSGRSHGGRGGSF